MDGHSHKYEIWATLGRVLPPLIASVVTKLAAQVKKDKTISWTGTILTTAIGGCGAILGYWISQYLGWTEYKMTLTIFFSGLIADNAFDVILSKTFLSKILLIFEKWVKNNISFLFNMTDKNNK